MAMVDVLITRSKLLNLSESDSVRRAHSSVQNCNICCIYPLLGLITREDFLDFESEEKLLEVESEEDFLDFELEEDFLEFEFLEEFLVLVWE